MKFTVTLDLQRDGVGHPELEEIQEALEQELDAMQVWVDDTCYDVTSSEIAYLPTSTHTKRVTR